MARYLITGIAGFIGSSLAYSLLQAGHQVQGIDNLSTGTLDNLAAIRDSVQVFQGDIQDTDLVQRACRGVDIVLHQAALASVPRSVKDPLSSHNANINGTLQVLLAARDNGVGRIVYAASSSAYGNQPTQPKHESMAPMPLSPYAVQKLTGEYYIQSFCKVYGMEGVCLRYFNIFGPRQAADSPYSGVIAQFIYKMLAGATPTINGDGTVSRDFTFISNAVQANLLAATAPSSLATGQVFNVGTGHTHSLNDLYQTLASILGFPHPPIYGPTRPGDVEHSLADITRATTGLGYAPMADFRRGLEETVSWYRQQLASAAVPIVSAVAG